MGRRALRPALAMGIVLSLGVSARVKADLADTETTADLAKLSMEELGNIKVSSVSKKAEPLSDAAAAVYVITHDDIMRAGANSIPEMLRLAPNLDVAQISANSYAISARGFNNQIADKLLVLIDGRSVYTPIFAGVYWDMQTVPAEDVERIEVISGPGGTLWGANAVNGVINIITRNSSETQGGVVDLGAGNYNNDGFVQYGGRAGAHTTYRVYGDLFSFKHSDTDTGVSAADGWHKGQGGFRLDWSRGGDAVTVQGDGYSGDEQEPGSSEQSLEGANLLSRWNHTFSGGSALQLQAYYDYARRFVPSGGGDLLNSYDIDIQHSFALNSWNAVVWGGGYRLDDYKVYGEPGFIFSPRAGKLHYGNFFVEDTIAITDKLKLIAGIKLEDDAYVGFEPLPSVRASWKVAKTTMLWAAVSRAVRAPTPFDRAVQGGGPPPLLVGGADFQSEDLTAYEVGIRTQPTADTSLSISTYYNHYTSLRSVAFTDTFFPVTFANFTHGNTYGVEAWAVYQINPWWRLSAGINLQHQKLVFDVPITSGILEPFEEAVAPLLVQQAIGYTGNDLGHQFSLRSSMDLPHDVTLDAEFREVGALPNPAVSGYVELNARIAWQATDELQLSLAGSNLLHDHHVEFVVAPLTVEIPRSFMVRVQRRF